MFATLALAQTDVVWKYYGRAVLNERMGKTELTCFYDENSIDHPTSGHVRVWTKCLDQITCTVLITTQTSAKR